MDLFKSNLERDAFSALRGEYSDVRYEQASVPVAIKKHAEPDFWLPDRGVVVECKGIVRSPESFDKLIATSEALPLLVRGVLYSRYIVAVQADSSDMKLWRESDGNLSSLRHLTVSKMPLGRLSLVKKLRKHGLCSVPVSHGDFEFLFDAIEGA